MPVPFCSPCLRLELVLCDDSTCNRLVLSASFPFPSLQHWLQPSVPLDSTIPSRQAIKSSKGVSIEVTYSTPGLADEKQLEESEISTEHPVVSLEPPGPPAPPHSDLVVLTEE